MSPRTQRIRVSRDRWLVSYADFITLLFAFFVVLYAFAKADETKQARVAAAIREAFQNMGVGQDVRDAHLPTTQVAYDDAPATQPTNDRDSAQIAVTESIQSDFEVIRRRLEHDLASQLAQHVVAIQMGRDGLVISLREAGFFNSGSAQPRAGAFGTLRQIADSVGKTAFAIRVEGHTDNMPIHSALFDSNWELSSARATKIARILIEQESIPADRLSAAGYAEFHPVASNATPEGQAANRRVDLVIMPRIRLNFTAHADRPEPSWHRITDN